MALLLLLIFAGLICLIYFVAFWSKCSILHCCCILLSSDLSSGGIVIHVETTDYTV